MNLKGLAVLLSTFFLFIFLSCTKINEATELGGDLIPAVDNVNTFETTLDVTTAYYPFDDSIRHTITTQSNDLMALGRLNDPAFGTTTADMYFNLGSLSGYGTYPFGPRVDSVKGIDSVVLSLAYAGSYGDSSIASEMGVQVFEIAPNNGFKEDSVYRFDSPGFQTTGSVLGSKTFTIRSLKDSVKIIRKNDTSTVRNVLRIRLNNSLGERFKSFDTSLTSGLGGFVSDSLFRTLFRGLAVKTATASGQGTLAYFNLVDAANTRLIVYYRVQRNGVIDSAASVSFGHIRLGQANSIRRVPGGDYLANLSKPSPQALYIQSSPSGSYVSMKVPGLDTFPNKVIHRAELIAYKVPTAFEGIFSVPASLYLDHKGSNNSKDSAYLFENDLQAGFDGSLNFASFGGNLRTDNTYRFNLTRYVQGIVTRKERNDSLRLFAPLRTNQYAKNLSSVISISILNSIANGRVAVGSGNASDPNTRLRLRIIYSNL